MILIEKLVAGSESTLCLTTLQKILATGVCEEDSDYGRKERDCVSLTTRQLSSGSKIWLPDCQKLPNVGLKDPSIPLVTYNADQYRQSTVHVHVHVRIIIIIQVYMYPDVWVHQRCRPWFKFHRVQLVWPRPYLRGETRGIH